MGKSLRRVDAIDLNEGLDTKGKKPIIKATGSTGVDAINLNEGLDEKKNGSPQSSDGTSADLGVQQTPAPQPTDQQIPDQNTPAPNANPVDPQKPAGAPADNTIPVPSFQGPAPTDVAPTKPAVIKPEEGPDDPITLALKANELTKASIPSTMSGGTGGAGTTASAYTGYEQAAKESAAIKAQLKSQGYDPDKLISDFQDFPQDAFGKNSVMGATTKEHLLELSKSNPIKYKQLLNSIKNSYAVMHNTETAIDNGYVPDFMKDYAQEAYSKNAKKDESFPDFIKRDKQNIAIEAHNSINAMYGAYGSIGELYQKTQQRQLIINQTLSGDERSKAINRLKDDVSVNIAATNPLFLEDYQKSEFKDKLDANQYAGLKVMQLFDEPRYNQAVKMLSIDPTEVKKGWDSAADAALGSTSELQDSQIKNKFDKAGHEVIMRNLADAGRENATSYINSLRFDYSQQYNATDDPELKKQLYAKDQVAMQADEALKIDARKDDERYPITTTLKYDERVKDMLDKDPGLLQYAAGRFSKTVANVGESVGNITSNITGDGDHRGLMMLGKSQFDNNALYLPEKFKTEDSPFLIKYPDAVVAQVKAIDADSRLTDDQKKQQSQMVLQGSEGKAITNPNQTGKNFWSKATAYQMSGFLGDIGGIVATSALMPGNQTVQAVAPMFLTSQADYYKQALENGESDPNGYANVHAFIVAMAGAVSPRFDYVKQVVSGTPVAENMMSQISEDTWNGIVSKERNKVQDIANGILTAGKENIKQTVTYGLGVSFVSDIADNALYNKDISLDQMRDHAGSAMKDLLIGAVPMTTVHAITSARTVPHSYKALLWELGDNYKFEMQKVDDALTNGDITPAIADSRKNAINEISSLIKRVPTHDTKGELLSDESRSDLLYNLYVKNKASKSSVELPEEEKKKFDDELVKIDDDNAKIISGVGEVKKQPISEGEQNTIDQKVASQQEKLSLPNTPNLPLSDVANETLTKIEKGDNILNADLETLSKELHTQYKTFSETKDLPYRRYTREQYDKALNDLERKITVLENHKNLQEENGGEFVKVDKEQFNGTKAVTPTVAQEDSSPIISSKIQSDGESSKASEAQSQQTEGNNGTEGNQGSDANGKGQDVLEENNAGKEQGDKPSPEPVLTKDAEDLLSSIGEGSKPTFITKNLERIAKENGIEVTGETTADDIVNALKEKQQSKPVPEPLQESSSKEVVANEPPKEEKKPADTAKDILGTPVSDEPPQPEGRKPATLSGLTEEERQQRISDRKEKTTLDDKGEAINALMEDVSRYNRMPNGRLGKAKSEGLQLLNSIRTRVSEFGLTFDERTGRVRKVAEPGKRKGPIVRPTFFDSAIDERGKPILQRDEKVQDVFNHFSDSNMFPVFFDETGKRMSDLRVDAAVRDIQDGVPSIRANRVLDQLEKYVEDNKFEMYSPNYGTEGVPFEKLFGADHPEHVGEPMDEDAVRKWLTEDSKRPEDHDIVDNIENFITDYENRQESGASNEVQQSATGRKEGGSEQTGSDAKDQGGDKAGPAGEDKGAEASTWSVKDFTPEEKAQADTVLSEDGITLKDIEDYEKSLSDNGQSAQGRTDNVTETSPVSEDVQPAKNDGGPNKAEGTSGAGVQGEPTATGSGDKPKDVAAPSSKKIKQFEQKVDQKAEALINLLTPKHLRDVKKAGLGIEELVHGAAEIIKAAYRAKESISKAVDEAIEFIKKGWNDKEWGELPEDALRSHLGDISDTAETLSADGVGISKKRFLDQYNRKADFAPVKNQERVDRVAANLAESAKRNGISVEQEAERQVNSMAGSESEAVKHAVESGKVAKVKGELIATDHNIITASYHLMNLEEKTDAMVDKIAKADNPSERQYWEDQLLQMSGERDKTIAVLRILSNQAGTNLQLFDGIFNKADNGTMAIERIRIAKAEGLDYLPKTEEDLKNSSLTPVERKIAEPYVKELEAAQKRLDEAEARSKATIKTEDEKQVTDKINKKRGTKEPGKADEAAKEVSERRKKIADKLDDIADKIAKFGKGDDTDQPPIQKMGFSIDMQKAVADAIHFIAKEIRDGKAAHEIIKDAVKQFTGGLSAEELHNNVVSTLKEVGLTDKEILGDKAAAIEQMKEIADNESSSSITKSMVEKGLVDDVVDHYVRGDISTEKVIEEATKDLKKHLPGVTEKQVADAYVRRNDFAADKKASLDKAFKEKKEELKRIINKESKLDALEKGVEYHAADPETKKEIRNKYEKDITGRIDDLTRQKDLLQRIADAKAGKKVESKDVKNPSEAVKALKKELADVRRQNELKQNIDDIKNGVGKEKRTPAEYSDEVKELQKEYDALRNENKEADRIEKVQQQIDALRDRGESFKRVVRSKPREVSEAYKKVRDELEKEYRNRGLRKEKGDKSAIEISQHADDMINAIKGNDLLSAEDKAKAIQDIKAERDEQVKGTMQGVMNNLADSVEGLHTDLTKELNDAHSDEKAMVHASLEDLHRDLKANPDTNIQDKLNAAHETLGDLASSVKDKGLKGRILDIQKELVDNAQRTNDELSRMRLQKQYEREIKEAQRKLNSGSFTKITTTPYDIRRDESLTMLAHQRKIEMGKVKNLTRIAQEKNLSTMDKLADARRDLLVSGTQTAMKVGEASVVKTFLDPIAELTFGRLYSMLTGAPGMSFRSALEGWRSVGRFKNEEAAQKHIEMKRDIKIAALEHLNTLIENGASASEISKAEDRFNKADIDYAAVSVYKSISGNSIKDFAQYMAHGATDWEQAQGKGIKRSIAERRSILGKILYVASGIIRTHAGSKGSLSGRVEMVRSYNSHIEEFKRQGRVLDEETVALAMAYASGDFDYGKMQQATGLSKLIQRGKGSDSKAARITTKVLVPVATAPLNIFKAGLDMSTLGAEGFVRLAKGAKEGMRLNELEGQAYDTWTEKVRAGINRLPVQERKYINRVLTNGMFGASLIGLTAIGMSMGQIKYGGPWDDHRKEKGSDGDALQSGEWEFFGWRAPGFLNKLFNHTPHFLPMALTANAYEISNNIDAQRARGKETNEKEVAWGNSTINEFLERLPIATIFNLLSKKDKVGEAERSLVSIPLAKEGEALFDNTPRETKGAGQKVLKNVGLNFLNPEAQLNPKEKVRAMLSNGASMSDIPEDMKYEAGITKHNEKNFEAETNLDKETLTFKRQVGKSQRQEWNGMSEDEKVKSAKYLKGLPSSENSDDFDNIVKRENISPDQLSEMMEYKKAHKND